jgi:hypothetical protein
MLACRRREVESLLSGGRGIESYRGIEIEMWIEVKR